LNDPVTPDSPTITRRTFLAGTGVAAVAAAAVLTGCAPPVDQIGGSDEDNKGFQGRLLDPPVAKPDVVFTDTSGQPFNVATDTEGELTLMFFGYTSCPDVCPIHMGIIDAAFEKVRLPDGDPTVVFVGVDTARDTPEQMREFLDRFSPRFIGLTASPADIDRAMAQVGLPPAVIDPEGTGGNYLVGHPSQFLVFTPDGMAHIVYPFGTREGAWVDDLPRLATIDWNAA
jgi:protein SCO1